MNIGATILFGAAVVLFLLEAYRQRAGSPLMLLGLACFAAAFVLQIVITAK